jgi:hypothetical protein
MFSAGFCERTSVGLRLLHSIVSENTVPYGFRAYERLQVAGSLSARANQIHLRALDRAKFYRASEADLIESLRKVEDEKVFVNFDLTSLYQCCVQILRLSEEVSCTLIAIMRKSRAVPELTEKIRNGSMTTSKARKIVSVINAENKNAWLELAQSKTSREIEKAVATANPKAAVVETIRYKTNERLEFTIGVSEEWLALLKGVKDLLSQEQRRAVTSEDVLEAVMRIFVDRRDPLRRAQRAQARSRERSQEREPARTRVEDNGERLQKSTGSENPSVPGRTGKRARLSTSTRHAVMLRDRRQCRHVQNDGTRCNQRRWLDVHHITPVSRDGSNEIDNLITLCSSHHAQRHSLK